MKNFAAILLLLSSTVCSAHYYTYSYDGLSRLTEARYTDGDGGTGRYDVTYEYDLNGNVTALQRSGLYDNGSLKKYGLIDNLTLEYEGNMLRRVTDGCGAAPFYQGAYHFVDGADETQEYTYDGNGNTTMDLNRRVTAVGYDTNNRPRLIEFDGGSSTAYLYDAAGLKRRTVHRVATEQPSVPGAEPQEPELSMTRTDYCGDIIYEDSLLSRINFDGGYLSFTNNAGERLDQPAYHFYHRDHLGNNRMDLGENGSVWQICHYYPYGMLMGCSYLGESQRWKFGGKELDRVSGLDLLDFEARPYDATLGRFWGVDPMAEDYKDFSPLLYCAANPMAVSDPTGMDWVKNTESNKYEWMDNVSNAKQTPSGYSYIGNSADEIIKDLNINSSQQSKKVSIGFGVETDRGFGVIMGAGSLVVTDIAIQSNIGQQESAKTENNAYGQVFEGITVTAAVAQKSTHTNEDYKTDYNGGMTISVGSFKESKPILPTQDKNGRISIAGYRTREASINVPAKEINRKNLSNGSIKIELGTLNICPFLPMQPIYQNFNLKK